MGIYINGQIEHGNAVNSFSVHNFDSIGDVVSQHPGWEIIFGDSTAAKGVEIEIRGKKYDLSKSPGLIYNGYEEHHEFFQRKHTNVRALVIAEDFIDSFLGDVSKSSAFAFQKPIIENENFFQIASSAYDFLRAGLLDKKESDLLAEVLVFEMADSLSHDQSLVKNFLGDNLNKMLFKEILIQLHRNISQPKFNLDDLSQELGVTKFHVIRTTKKIGGLTPHSYLSKIRLLKAKDLIMNGAGSISSIALLCGFEDLSTFNKSFKKRFGVAPSALRH